MLDVGPREARDGPSRGTLVRDGEDLPTDGKYRRVFGRHIPVEGMDGRQSRVPRRGCVAAMLFEVLEKGQDRVAADIVDREVHDGTLASRRRKSQQAANRVSIGMDGVRTHVARDDQMATEESLDQVGE